MSTSLRTLKGVGEKTEKLFSKIGVTDVESLLSYYPRNYDAYEEPVEIKAVEESSVVAISGTVVTGVCESGEKSSSDYNYGGGSYREAFGYLV